MPKFAHIRYKEKDGTIACRGGITVAYEQIEDSTFKYAVAICHEHDNYNKRIGRAKAAGRLNSKHYCEEFKTTNPQDLIQYILGLIPSNWCAIRYSK